MSEPVRPSADVKPSQRKGSLLRTVRAVAWSLIGLRKGSEYQQDVEKLNPIHIIVVVVSPTTEPEPPAFEAATMAAR